MKLVLVLLCLPLSLPFTTRYITKFSWKTYLKLNDEKSLSDPIDSFNSFDKILFNRFALAVATELSKDKMDVPTTYNTLIAAINRLTHSRCSLEVNYRSKNMLVRLFPRGLLPAYKVIFGLFPTFSARMNAWVTHITTQWLMGNSQVIDNEKEKTLIVEKCRFLETSGCIQTCIHACKVPTQNFFYDEMGLPVTLKPNLTDYSCRFEFGQFPLPVEQDSSLRSPCLSLCTRKNIDACK